MGGTEGGRRRRGTGGGKTGAGSAAEAHVVGPKRQANGWVWVKGYKKFLQGVRRGDVDRMGVVPEGGTKRALAARPRNGPVRRYANYASYEPAPERYGAAAERDEKWSKNNSAPVRAEATEATGGPAVACCE